MSTIYHFLKTKCPKIIIQAFNSSTDIILVTLQKKLYNLLNFLKINVRKDP